MDTNDCVRVTTPSIDNAVRAFKCECFPCNPLPFAKALGDLVRENGTDSIRSDEARAILWILMAQAYGQMATVDLCDEWTRLDKAIESE